MGEGYPGGILQRVLDAPRRIPLLWAALCLLGFAALAWAVTGDRSPLDQVDQWGRTGEDWADDNGTFVRALRRIDSLSFQGRDVGAWLVTIARNIVRDHVKSSRYRLEVTTADMRDADRVTEGVEDVAYA